MVCPPKYARSIRVTNTSGANAKITATYHSDEKVTATNRHEGIDVVTIVNHDGNHTFEEKMKNMGTWTATVPIRQIAVDIDGNTQVINIESVVDSVVGLLHLKLTSPSEYIVTMD